MTQQKLLDDPCTHAVYIHVKRKLTKYYFNKKGVKTFNTRPIELKYLHIAKATGYTYKQVRTRIDKLVDNGILEKYQAWSEHNLRKNYYRLKASN